MSINDFYETSDLCLSATLLWLGFRLDAVDKGSPKAKFIFQRSEDLNKAIETFWSGEIRVEPKSFFNCIKEIKSRLYA
jgi:hypothetical protein